jgi:hypothetical protein
MPQRGQLTCTCPLRDAPSRIARAQDGGVRRGGAANKGAQWGNYPSAVDNCNEVMSSKDERVEGESEDAKRRVAANDAAA